MEIERKWLVEGLPPLEKAENVFRMDQGYLTVRPTVRIRREALEGGDTHYILCIKGEGGLSRREVEVELTPAQFGELEEILPADLIPKTQWRYPLPGSLTLEVNQVDRGRPTEFWYAEVEFPTESAALSWDPEAAGLGEYLSHEVTGQKGQSMGEYWIKTRL